MPSDNRFFTGPSLQMYFVDKTTGLPLTEGILRFFKDNAREEPKPVYKLSGSPPNYTFTDIGNEVVLTGVGTFSDNLGNDIIPFFFPFDGTPDDTNETVELYFVRVFSNGLEPQFTREAWPPNVEELLSEGATSFNYIPNGQLFLHTDIPEDVENGYAAGEIREDVTEIAQGGFTFERSTGADSTDFVIFDRFGDYVDNPTASPKYSVNVSCTSVGSGTDVKDIRIKFTDVNKFSTTDAIEQLYTFSVTGKTNVGSTGVVQIYLIKNFGTGGSSETEEELTSFTFTSSFSIKNVAFTFGNNEGETIGDENDDFVQLAVRFPTDEIFNMNVTNFILAFGDVNIIIFPEITDKDFIARSLVPALPPAYDGNDLGLVLRTDKAGTYYDSNEVGDLCETIRSSKKGWIKCDGTQYPTDGYDPDTGIPYSRLQAVLWDYYGVGTSGYFYGVPMYGTGANFVTARINFTLATPGANEINIHTNIAATASVCTDGTVATGFAFSTISAGSASGYGVYSVWNIGSLGLNPSLILFNSAYGSVTAVGNGTSGFNVSTILRKGSTLTQQITKITTNTVSAGQYFTFSTPSTNYYVWYKINGSGSDPAPGGTGILVNLTSNDDAPAIANKTSNTLNGYTCSLVTCNAGSTLVGGGKYFKMHSSGGTINDFYVWYKCDGAGVDPAVVGYKGILVEVSSADSAAVVASKTRIAINMTYFAAPNFIGQTLRCLDPTQIYDSGPRYSDVDGIGGANGLLGTFELDSILSHNHTLGNQIQEPGVSLGGGTSAQIVNGETGYTGITETRGYNAAVNIFIKL